MNTFGLVLAIALMIFGIFVIINNNSRLNYLKVIILITILISSLALMNRFDSLLSGNEFRLTNIKENSEATTRPMLWYTGITAIVKHPLGITNKQYKKVKQDMSKKLGKADLALLNSHNGLINIGFNYSSVGYLIVLMFAFFLLKSLKFLSKNFKYLFQLFFIAYFINISFHNNFIFISDYDILMVVMIIPLHFLYEQNLLKEKN